jgi:selenocysteine lyase/cysteine desulfurase
MSATTAAAPAPVDTTAPLLDVVGSDLQVPLVTGGTTRFVHLDQAASAPALRAVADAVADFLPWYSSVHRGAGFTSTVSSEALEAARSEVAHHVGARHDDVVVFTRNTTDSLNLLARALPEGTVVLTLDLEHHANLLPWRRGSVRHLPTPPSVAEVPAVFDRALTELDTSSALVAVTGASNVTGEVLPLAEIAAVAHRHGARLVADGAQLLPHRGISIAALDVDYVVFSGHKVYAPYGAGAVVGRRDWLDRAAPYLAGGGAVRLVGIDDVAWYDAPVRHEGGTPNVVGAVALATALRTLRETGIGRVEAHDAELTRHLIARLAELEGLGVQVLSAFDDSDRVGVATFTVPDSPALIAAALSAEHGIATRDGAFCAHPLMRRLSGVDPSTPPPNAVRASVGVGSRRDDIDRFVAALEDVLRNGPRWTYAVDHGRLLPSPDPRPRPTVGGLA